MSTYQALDLVQNVFGEWVSPQTYAPPPCLSIPITPQLRALEAERAKREPVSDWKIKTTLDERNLLGPKVRKTYVRTAPLKGCKAYVPHPRTRAVREPRPRLEGNGRPKCACGMWVTWDCEGKSCYRCRRRARASWRPCAGGCGHSVTNRNIGDLCYRCRKVAGIRLDKKSGKAYLAMHRREAA